MQKWLGNHDIVINGLSFVLICSLLLDRLVHELSTVYFAHSIADPFSFAITFFCQVVYQAVKRILGWLLNLALFCHHY